MEEVDRPFEAAAVDQHEERLRFAALLGDELQMDLFDAVGRGPLEEQRLTGGQLQGRRRVEGDAGEVVRGHGGGCRGLGHRQRHRSQAGPGLGLQPQGAAAVARHVEELQAPGPDPQPGRFFAEPPGHRNRRRETPAIGRLQGGHAVVEPRVAALPRAADVELRPPAGHQVGEALAGGGLDVLAADAVGLHQAQQHPFPEQVDQTADEEIRRPARGERKDAPVEPHGGRLAEEGPHEPVVLVRRLLHQVLGQVRQPLVEPGLLADSLAHEDVLVEADQVLQLVGEQGAPGLLGDERVRPQQVGQVAVPAQGPGQQRRGAELSGGADILHQVGHEDRDPAVPVHVGSCPEGLHHDRVVLGELVDDRLHPPFVDVVVVLAQVFLDPGHDALVHRRHPRLEGPRRDAALPGEAEQAAVADLVLHRRRLARPKPLLLHPQGQGPLELPRPVVDGIAAVGRRRRRRPGQGGRAVEGDVVRPRRVEAFHRRRVEGEDQVPLLQVDAGLDAPRGVGPQMHEVGGRSLDLQPREGDRDPGPEGIVADEGEQPLVAPRAVVPHHDLAGLAGPQHGGEALDLEGPFHLGGSQLDGGVPPVEQGDPALSAGQQRHGQHSHLQVGQRRVDALDDDLAGGPDPVVLQLEDPGQTQRAGLPRPQPHGVVEASILHAGKDQAAPAAVDRLQGEPEPAHGGIDLAGQDQRTLHRPSQRQWLVEGQAAEEPSGDLDGPGPAADIEVGIGTHDHRFAFPRDDVQEEEGSLLRFPRQQQGALEPPAIDEEEVVPVRLRLGPELEEDVGGRVVVLQRPGHVQGLAGCQAGRQRLIEMDQREVAPGQRHRSLPPVGPQAVESSQERLGPVIVLGMGHQVELACRAVSEDGFPLETAIDDPAPEVQLEAVGTEKGEAEEGDAVVLHAPRQRQGLARFEGGRNGVVQDDAGKVVPRYLVGPCQEGAEQHQGHREGETHRFLQGNGGDRTERVQAQGSHRPGLVATRAGGDPAASSRRLLRFRPRGILRPPTLREPDSNQEKP